MCFQSSSRGPFPFNLSPGYRHLLAVYLALILIAGLKCRRIIYNFLVSPDTKVNLINGLILANLISGSTFGTINLVIGIFAAMTSHPVSEVLGDDFCSLFTLQAGLHLTGSIIWNSLLAVSRILFIKVG